MLIEKRKSKEGKYQMSHDLVKVDGIVIMVVNMFAKGMSSFISIMSSKERVLR